ncbi:DUF1566 domain-containing protein [Microbulbifer rhizosphaerae]|uniref:Lcl C-terminal domain-containing protein n=1 Tax=Microbulbifer rhizosphaerae TaxID=1562603 RepID=A0A7W4WB96_9GAMM|nr:DUF1566 domain-containing protein [Microbulbifer rhizosphaerae]MBB3060517.1 hypothetical protein [Microbulbifer rhizosphaerae]
MFIRNSFVVLLSVLALTACGNGVELDTRAFASNETPHNSTGDPAEDPIDDPVEDPVEDPIEEPIEEPVDEETPPSEPSTLVKLGSDGAPLAIQSVAWSDSGSETEGSQWACVQDTSTGLTWEVKQPGDNRGRHSADSSFSWHQPDSETLNKAEGMGQCYVDGTLSTGSDCNTRTSVERIRMHTLCGQSNWRVPSRAELATLVFQDDNGAVHHIGSTVFPGIDGSPGLQYWSNDGGDKWHAWALDVPSGEAVLREPHEALRVRLVSANLAPTAIPQRIGMDPDQGPIEVILAGEDPDEDNLTYALVTMPQHGKLLSKAPNLVYVPDPDYRGEDSFTFTVNDGSYTSEPATVSIGIAPLISTNPATPTPISLEELAADEARPFLLDETTSGGGEVRGYLALTVPAQTDIMQDLHYFVAAQNIRSEQAARYSLELYEEGDFTGSPEAQGIASSGVKIRALNNNARTVYLTIQTSNNADAFVYLELHGSKTSQQNLLSYFCDQSIFATGVPSALCSPPAGWEVECNDDTCVSINPAPEVDRKYVCADQSALVDIDHLMRCWELVASTGEILAEICPPPAICTTITIPDWSSLLSIPLEQLFEPNPIELTYNTPSVTIEVPTGPAYGVNLSQQLFLDAVRGNASQQILDEFLQAFSVALETDTAQDAALAPLRDYLNIQLDSGMPVPEIMAQIAHDTGNGNEEAGALLFTAMKKLISELTRKEQATLNHAELWLLTITMAHINDRRETLVATAERKVEEYYQQLGDSCVGTACLFMQQGFPDVLAGAIAETDADLATWAAAGGAAVISGVYVYLAVTSTAVLSVALPHAVAVTGGIAAAVGTASSLAALPVAIVVGGVVATVVSVSNLVEAGENQSAYNHFIEENSARFESLETFIDTEHSNRVQAEITNAAIRMTVEMYW